MQNKLLFIFEFGFTFYMQINTTKDKYFKSI
jgi:hypothetical protein